MSVMDHRWIAALVLPASLVLGCPASEMSMAPGAYDDDDQDAGEWADDDAAGDDDTADDDDDGPPEEEDDFVTVAPSAADVYVFVVNPHRDTVSKVHVMTRQITTLEVGDEPSQVLVTDDYERAVVFNDGADSVSVIDVDTNEVRTVSVREDFNYLTMSPTGGFAVCYLNTGLLEGTETFQGVLSYTEVSIVDLDQMVSHDFSVGFNPRQVKFAVDAETGTNRAVIISNEFITVVDLDADPVEPRMLDLGADPFEPPVAAEVEVEPGGQFAFVRYENQDEVQVVDLETGDLAWIEAGQNPTDMDLSPDGSELMIVARTSGELWTYDAADPGAAPSLIQLPGSETIGSLSMSPTSGVALLYTTAELTDRVTVWDRSVQVNELTGEEVRRLAKPVDQVIMAPDGQSVVVVHTLDDVPGEYDIYTDNYAMTVLTLGPDTFVPNAAMLEDELVSLANFDAGGKAVFMMADNRNVGIIDYPSRLVDDLQVPSYPVHVGVMPTVAGLPDPVAWVSQDHPLGRMSFVDPETLEAQTVTGFELNSGIE
jgi:hypothetical protein